MTESETARAILKAIEECIEDGLGIGDDWVRDGDVRKQIPCFSGVDAKKSFRRWLRRMKNEGLVELQNSGDDWVVRITGPGDPRLVATDEDGAETAETPRMSSRAEAFSGDWLFDAVTNAVPAAQGRIDLPLRILTDYLTRGLISPEVAWEKLRAIPSDERYSIELRRQISNELAHLSQPPGDVAEPAIDALRDMLRSRVEKTRREGVKIVCDRILSPPEIKDYEAAKRAQRLPTESEVARPEPAPAPQETHAGIANQDHGRAEGASRSQRYDRELTIDAADDLQLVLYPAPHHFAATLVLSRRFNPAVQPVSDCYLWRIHNRALRSLREIRLELADIQTFDDRKSALRERINLGFRWPVVRDLGAGARTNEAIFLRVDGDQVRLWNHDSTPTLPWPNGDQSPIRCWRLTVAVIGLSSEWSIQLDLRWTVETRCLEIARSGDGILATEPPTLSPTTEAVTEVVTSQEFPKSMSHATKEPVLVHSAHEQAELGPEWSETNIKHAYPGWKHHWTKKARVVNNAKEDAELGGGWADSSAVFEPYRGPRVPPAGDQDVIKWVADWPVTSLSPKDRAKIEAAVLRADSAFWAAPDGEGADLAAMKLAFDAVAKVLFDAGALTGQLLRNEIPLLVWDSGIAGRWYRFADETPARILPERVGHYYVWRDEDKDWKGLFRAETAKWLAELLEASTEMPQPEARARQDVPADAPHAGPLGVALEPGQSAEAIPALPKRLDNAENNPIAQSEDDDVFDFRTADRRIEAIVRYTEGWSDDSGPCSEASLARTAVVDPGDLSKWKRGLLPPGSDKARRIEEALRTNKPPTPVTSRIDPD